MNSRTTVIDQTELQEMLASGEGLDIEFKSGRGGVPKSLWHSYSAFANTSGGTIVLGVRDEDDTFRIEGVENPSAIQRQIWDLLNDRNKVSANLLSPDGVHAVKLGEKNIVVMEVPRANRKQRPVYIGQNPMTGTYRRNYEGDYLCNYDEVKRMFSDQSDDAFDCTILEHFTLDDFDEESVRRYRNRLDARSPDHPWLVEELGGFLEKIGAWRTERGRAGVSGPTIAGLLMFGKTQSICDPAAIPAFHLDYREHLSDDLATRWTDRLVYDGTWEVNIFQFYSRVIQRLFFDLKMPFQLDQDLVRRDETVVHEAVREALVNALVHADYQGQGGVVVQKYRDRFELSNPGMLLISREQLLRGGISECRNLTLQKMFQLIGLGDKAGSGMNKIQQGWRSQHWRSPSVTETFQPDRVRLLLPMIIMMPEESLRRLDGLFGEQFHHLNEDEVQALVTADVEGVVTNARMQEITTKHSAHLTKMLQGLVAREMLLKDGRGRWASYRLPEITDKEIESLRGGEDSSHTAGDSLRNGEDSLHSEENSLHTKGDSLHKQLPKKVWKHLEAVARPVATRKRVKPEVMREVILTLCRDRYLTVSQLGQLLNRNPDALRNRSLSPMVHEGLLMPAFPTQPNRPDQAYTTVKDR